MRYNLPIDSPCVYTNIVNVTNALTTALAPYSLTYVKLPVLFDYDSDPNSRGFYASSANVVNCLVYPGQGIFVQTTGNAEFDSYTSSHVPSVIFVDIWNDYHRYRGEVHCGTATKRTIDFDPPWWECVPWWE